MRIPKLNAEMACQALRMADKRLADITPDELAELLDHRNQGQTKTTPTNENYLNLSIAAPRLGMKLPGLRAAIKNGRIPGRMIGKRWKVAASFINQPAAIQEAAAK